MWEKERYKTIHNLHLYMLHKQPDFRTGMRGHRRCHGSTAEWVWVWGQCRTTHTLCQCNLPMTIGCYTGMKGYRPSPDNTGEEWGWLSDLEPEWGLEQGHTLIWYRHSNYHQPRSR